MDDLRERLAAYAHEAWSGWMRYMFEKGSEVEGHIVLMPNEVERWKQQMNTPYKDLPEQEKASDRVEANKMMQIFGIVERQ